MPCAFFFPSDYAVGASNLGFHYIFRALRENGIGAERFFFSPNPLRSFDSDERIDKFSLILASISYEGDYINLCQWLHANGISLFNTERNERTPLIGAGGAISYINPLLLASVCDFIVLGDGLPVLPFLLDEIRHWGVHGDKARLLDSLATHENILVPGVHLMDKVHSFNLSTAKGSESDMGNSSWMTPRSVFGKTLLMEIQRGCFRRCSYCTLPNCFTPCRQKNFEQVKHELNELVARHKFDQVGLVTPEAGDYPYLPEVLNYLEALNKSVSFASLRADALTSQMVEALVRGGRRSITLAPETGNEELRYKCGKNFTNDRLIEALYLARDHGVKQAKLYFMVGLPGEIMEDIESIPLLCKRIYTETSLNIHLSVGQFVPKPKTPWETCPFEDALSVKKKYRSIMHGLGHYFKKTPMVRFVSTNEAKKEFILTWAGYDVSMKYALQSVCSISEKYTVESRELTLIELARLGLHTVSV